MPGPVTHLVVALALLDSQSGTPRLLPFPTDDPTAREAFCLGALAPDMGYFPGGNTLLTDLAHYRRSAGLARSLFVEASTSLDTAFASGWLTHVLLDIRIHPLVNSASGELTFGARGRALSYAEDPVAHIRVEAGLDGHELVLHPEVRNRWHSTHLIPWMVTLLQRAYCRTYAVEFDRIPFDRSLRAMNRGLPWLFRLAGCTACRESVSACTPEDRLWRRWLLNPLGWTVGHLPFNKRVAAFADPRVPSEWFGEAVAEILDSFPSDYQGLLRNGLPQFPDHNLDLGRPAAESPNYPPELETGKRLTTLMQKARRRERRP